MVKDCRCLLKLLCDIQNKIVCELDFESIVQPCIESHIEYVLE